MSTPVGHAEATRTVVLWCDDWPVVAFGYSPDREVVVLSANRVVAGSFAARSSGVVVGARRREAQRHCPAAVVVDRDPDREARYFEPVLSALDEVTPRIEITEPGSALFPARGPARYFGGEEAMCRRITELVQGALTVPTALGVGVADGAFAATLAARQAVLATGVALVPPGKSPRFLSAHSVATLRRPELTEVLEQLGLRTLGAFAALPPHDVLARFGREGSAAHRLALGLDLRPPQLHDPPVDLDVVVELDPPLERIDQVAFVAKAAADELHERLGGRGLAAVALIIEGTTSNGALIERRWRHDGVLSSAAIAQRVRWQLDGWVTSTGGRTTRGAAALVRLRLRPDDVVPDTGRQLGFWGGIDAGAERARRGVARVQGVLGNDSATMAEWRGGRAVGERYRLVPFDTVPLGEMGQHIDPAGGDAPWPGSLPDPPPALVWPQQRSAQVNDGEGRAVAVNRRGVYSAAPAKVSIEGGPWEEIVTWAGPWTTDERWWDAVGHRRRARFQVQVASGRAHLLTLEAQRWWVEATYD